MDHLNKISSEILFLKELCFGFDLTDHSLTSFPIREVSTPLEKTLKDVLKKYIDEAKGSVGLFLSGGLDSSYLGALLLDIMGPTFKTYTLSINYPGVCQSDREAALFLSRQWSVPNHSLCVDVGHVVDHFRQDFHNRPDCHINSFKMQSYCSLVSQELPNVLLTGIGVDELLGSSPWSRKFYRFHSLPGTKWLECFFPRSFLQRWSQKALKLLHPDCLALGLRSLFYPVNLEKINERVDATTLFAQWTDYWKNLHPEDDLERFQKMNIAYDLKTIQIPAFKLFTKSHKVKIVHPYLEPEVML